MSLSHGTWLELFEGGERQRSPTAQSSQWAL